MHLTEKNRALNSPEANKSKVKVVEGNLSPEPLRSVARVFRVRCGYEETAMFINIHWNIGTWKVMGPHVPKGKRRRLFILRSSLTES